MTSSLQKVKARYETQEKRKSRANTLKVMASTVSICGCLDQRLFQPTYYVVRRLLSIQARHETYLIRDILSYRR